MATLKYSRQRESIKEFLMTRKDHPTADVVYENIRKIQRHFTFVYGIIKQEYDQRKGVYANEYFVFYHTEK